MEYGKIKAEYIAGGISCRRLAEKYGVSYGSLRRVAERERWTELRAQTERKTDAEITKNVSRRQARVANRIAGVSEKILDRIETALDREDSIGSQSAKDYATALKRLQEIGGIKSELDTREQEARIKRLESDAAVGEVGGLSVTFDGEMEEYAE